MLKEKWDIVIFRNIRELIKNNASGQDMNGSKQYEYILIRKINDINFENILNGMLTLLIFSTLENWPTIMFQFADGDTENMVFCFII